MTGISEWAQFDLTDLNFVGFAILSALMDCWTRGLEVFKSAECRSSSLCDKDSEKSRKSILQAISSEDEFKATLLIHIIDFDALVAWKKKKKASQTIRVQV